MKKNGFKISFFIVLAICVVLSVLYIRQDIKQTQKIEKLNSDWENAATLIVDEHKRLLKMCMTQAKKGVKGFSSAVNTAQKCANGIDDANKSTKNCVEALEKANKGIDVCLATSKNCVKYLNKCTKNLKKCKNGFNMCTKKWK